MKISGILLLVVVVLQASLVVVVSFQLKSIYQLRKEMVVTDVMIQPELKKAIVSVNDKFPERLRNSDIVNDSIAYAVTVWCTYYGIPIRTLLNVAGEESDFHPPAKGKDGEIGLCQIMSSTAIGICDELGLGYKKTSDNFYIIVDGKEISLFNIYWNIRFGCYHLWRSNFWRTWSSALQSYNGSKEYVLKIRNNHTRNCSN